MPVRVSYRLRDSEADTKLSPVVVDYADGQTLAQLQTIVTATIPLIEAVIGGYVEEADAVVTFLTTASGGGPSPAGVFNERGAVFLFETDGTRRESVHLPQILQSLMPADVVDIEDADVAAFLDVYVTGVSNGTAAVPAQTPYGAAWVEPIRGRKSQRKR